MVIQIIPTSLKKTLIEQSNRLRPKVNIANKRMQGIIRKSRNPYSNPNQCMSRVKTIRESSRLNNSLSISDNGKKTEGIFRDFNKPADPIIFPTLWPVTFAKKNHSIRPDMAYRTKCGVPELNRTINMSRYINGFKNPQRNPTKELLYLNITFRLLKAYIRVIFCTLWILLILCSDLSSAPVLK